MKLFYTDQFTFSIHGEKNFPFQIYIAGADPFLDDRFGRLSLSKNGLADRDCMVFHRCAERSIPVAITMGGGNSRKVSDTVEIHFQTVRIAVETGRSRVVVRSTGREAFPGPAEANSHG